MFGAKAEIAALEKGLDVELIMVPFEMKTLYQPKHPEVLRINPKRQVPVLIDGDLELFDSTHVSVGEGLVPHHVVHRLDAGQEHGDTLQAVGDLRGNRREVDASRLLKVGELRDLHSVHHNLPADTPGPERGRLPVVFLETQVVVRQRDAQTLEARQIHRLHVLG